MNSNSENCNTEYRYFKLTDISGGKKNAFDDLNEMMKKEGWIPVREMNLGTGYLGNNILILLKRELRIAEVKFKEI